MTDCIFVAAFGAIFHCAWVVLIFISGNDILNMPSQCHHLGKQVTTWLCCVANLPSSITKSRQISCGDDCIENASHSTVMSIYYGIVQTRALHALSLSQLDWSPSLWQDKLEAKACLITIWTDFKILAVYSCGEWDAAGLPVWIHYRGHTHIRRMQRYSLLACQ